MQVLAESTYQRGAEVQSKLQLYLDLQTKAILEATKAQRRWLLMDAAHLTETDLAVVRGGIQPWLIPGTSDEYDQISFNVVEVIQIWIANQGKIFEPDWQGKDWEQIASKNCLMNIFESRKYMNYPGWIDFVVRLRRDLGL